MRLPLSLALLLVGASGSGSCTSAACPCGQSSSLPAASCLGAYTFCGYTFQTIWIQPAVGVSPYQVYCGDVGLTLAMLINGARTTFPFQSSYWTSGWSAGQSLGQDATQYATYTTAATEALFQSFNNLPGTSVRISMTAVTSGGSFSGGGTGANLDIPLGTFSSLLSLFNSTITVYSSQQAGQPAQWWATGNTYVAYSLPLALSVSLWYGAVPGSPAYEPNCNLQGVNVYSQANPATLNLQQPTNGVRYRLGIVYNNEADCNSPDAGFGIGGDCFWTGTVVCPAAGQFAGCCCSSASCAQQAAYTTVWVLATTPSSCQAGFYCPLPYSSNTTQVLCPAGYYCVANSATFLNSPCQAGYWGPAGQTTSTCAGLCASQPACPTQSATPSASPTLSPTQSQSATLTGSSTQSASATPSSTLTQSPSQTLSTSGTTTPSQTQSRSQSQTPSGTQTLTPSGTQTLTPSGTQTGSQPLTASATITSSATLTPSPTQSPSGTRTPSSTASPSLTQSSSQTLSPSGTVTSSATISASITQSASQGETLSTTISPSISLTASVSSTPSRTLTASQTTTASPSPTRSQTQSSSETQTQNQTGSSTVTSSSIQSPSLTQSPSGTATASLTQSPSGTSTASATGSPSQSLTPSATLTRSAAVTPSMTQSASATGIASATVTASSTGSLSQSLSKSTAQSPSSTASISYSPSNLLSLSVTSSRTVSTGTTQSSSYSHFSSSKSDSSSASGTASATTTPFSSVSGSISATIDVSESTSVTLSQMPTRSRAGTVPSIFAPVSRSVSASASSPMTSTSLLIAAPGTQNISGSLVPSASAMYANSTFSDGAPGQPFTYQIILAISASLTVLLVVLLLVGMCALYYRCRGCCFCGAPRPHKFAAPPAVKVVTAHAAAGDGATGREADEPMSLCVDTDAVEDARQDALAITPPVITLGNAVAQAKSDAASSAFATHRAATVAQAGPPMLVPERASHPPTVIPGLAATRELPHRRHSLACPPNVGGSTMRTEVGDVRLGGLQRSQPRPGVVAHVPVQPVGPGLPVAPVIAPAPVGQPAINIHGQSDTLQLARAAQRRGSLPLIPSHVAVLDRTAATRADSQPHLDIPSRTGVEHAPGSGIGRRRASFLASVASSVVAEQAGCAGSRYQAGLLTVPGGGKLPRPGLVSRPQPVSNAWLVGPDATQRALHQPLDPSMEYRYSQDSESIPVASRASVIGATESDVITLASVNIDYATQGTWATSPPGRTPVAAYRRQTIPVPDFRRRFESGHVQLPPRRGGYPPAHQYYFGRAQRQENSESALPPGRHDGNASSTDLRNAPPSGAMALASGTEISASRILHSPEHLVGRQGRWADAMSRSSAASMGPAMLASRSQAAMAVPSSLRGRRVSV